MSLPEPSPLPVGRSRSRDRRPAAPRHLKTAGKRLWASVVEQVELDGHHEELLRLASEALDRADEARETLSREGLTQQGRWGSVPHPCIGIEKDSAIRAARLIRELGIDITAEPKSRPPSRWRP